MKEHWLDKYEERREKIAKNGARGKKVLNTKKCDLEKKERYVIYYWYELLCSKEGKHKNVEKTR